MINFLKSLSDSSTEQIQYPNQPILSKITYGKRISISTLNNQPNTNEAGQRLISRQSMHCQQLYDNPRTILQVQLSSQFLNQFQTPKQRGLTCYQQQNYQLQKRQKQLISLQKILEEKGFPREPDIYFSQLYKLFHILSINFHGAKQAIGGKLLLKVCISFIKIKDNKLDLDNYKFLQKKCQSPNLSIIRNMTQVELKSREQNYQQYLVTRWQNEYIDIINNLRKYRLQKKQLKEKNEYISQMEAANSKKQRKFI